MNKYAVYIMANKKNGTLYIGVTSNLSRRVYEHKQSVFKGFSAKYKCTNLVFYEYTTMMIAAIAREKQLKSLLRIQKMKLIESVNSGWVDLYGTLND